MIKNEPFLKQNNFSSKELCSRFCNLKNSNALTDLKRPLLLNQIRRKVLENEYSNTTTGNKILPISNLHNNTNKTNNDKQLKGKKDFKNESLTKRNLFADKNQKMKLDNLEKENYNVNSKTYRERSRLYNESENNKIITIQSEDNIEKKEGETDTFSKITSKIDDNKSSLIITNYNNYFINDLSLSNQTSNKSINEKKIENFSFSLIFHKDFSYSSQENITNEIKSCYKCKQSKLDSINYGKDIHSNFIIDQYLMKRFRYNQSYINKFNKISEKMRGKMIDWMIEVLNNYKCDENTFFIAVEIMDSYIMNNNKDTIFPQDLHLIGCTVMFIASKLNDIKPIKLSIIEERISHGKLSKDEIKREELKIIEILRFNLIFPTVFDFANIYFYRLFDICFEETCHQQDKKTHLQYDIQFKRIMVYLLKIVNFDFKIISNLPSVIAAGCINVSSKILEKMLENNGQLTDNSHIKINVFKRLIEISGVNMTDLCYISREILLFSQGFDQYYSDCVNIKSFIDEILNFNLN